MKLWGIRVAVVCPWFTDTSILATPTRVMLAGLPMTPLSRVAGSVVHAATDPNWETSGASYALPDDGTILRIDRQELAVGSYKILHERLHSVSRFVHSHPTICMTNWPIFLGCSLEWITTVEFLETCSYWSHLT